MFWVLIRIASASLSLNYPQIPSLSGLLVQTIFVQFVFCTKLFTEKHVHFTTPDEVMTLILFKFLYCSFYEKKKKNIVNVLKISTHCFCFYKMFINELQSKNICCRSSS